MPADARWAASIVASRQHQESRAYLRLKSAHEAHRAGDSNISYGQPAIAGAVADSL